LDVYDEIEVVDHWSLGRIMKWGYWRADEDQYLLDLFGVFMIIFFFCLYFKASLLDVFLLWMDRLKVISEI
jgi:hypothetical protein